MKEHLCVAPTPQASCCHSYFLVFYFRLFLCTSFFILLLPTVGINVKNESETVLLSKEDISVSPLSLQVPQGSAPCFIHDPGMPSQDRKSVV